MSGKKFYLTPNEFSVISAGFGLSMVYGLKQIDGRVDNKEICMALHNMYVNQLIENQNEQGFVADDEIAEMIKGMKESTQELVIDFSEGSKLNTICCYRKNHSKQDIVIEENCLNPDKIIMFFSDWEEVVRDILELTDKKNIVVRILDTKDGHICKHTEISSDADDTDRREILNQYHREVMQNDLS